MRRWKTTNRSRGVMTPGSNADADNFDNDDDDAMMNRY
jgi:hypothetical protein